MKEKILTLLQKDARLTAVQIADRLMADVDEVAAIIGECEQQSIIYGYCALVRDESLAASQVRALIEVSVQPERDGGFDRIARIISRFPEVTDVSLVSGSYDLLLVVIGDNLQEVAHFVASKLAPLDGVTSTRTHFMLKKYKQHGFQPEEDEDYERLSVSP